VLLADSALGELRKKDPPVVHHTPEVQGPISRSHHPTHQLAPQEGIEPGEDRRLGGAFEHRKLRRPEVPCVVVADSREELTPESLIHEKTPQVKKRSAPV